MAQVQKMNWWYWAFMDWMIANPGANIADAAPLFNVHVQTLYIVKNSDSFKRAFDLRVKELSTGLNENIVTAFSDVGEKAAALAEITLDTLTERVQRKGRDLTIPELTSVADLALKKIGYGVEPPTQSSQVTINIAQANGAALAEARRKLENYSPKLIEVQKAGDPE